MKSSAAVRSFINSVAGSIASSIASSIGRRGPIICALMIYTALSGCGVRGKPQPPLTPAELGRGKPTFRRGTEEFAFPAVPTPSSLPDRRATPSDHEDNG